jgi:hypothetical protein
MGGHIELPGRPCGVFIDGQIARRVAGPAGAARSGVTAAHGPKAHNIRASCAFAPDQSNLAQYLPNPSSNLKRAEAKKSIF